MRELLIPVVALAILPGLAQAQDLRGWETPRATIPTPPPGSCAAPMDRSLVVAVYGDLRREAIRLLRRSHVIMLTTAQARRLTGGPPPANAGRDDRPFLARAVAGSESTGSFGATMCGSWLLIGHGSMSHEPPTPARVPVVVWLGRPPTKVYATWAFAQ